MIIGYPKLASNFMDNLIKFMLQHDYEEHTVCLMEIEGLQVWASMEALCCVLEQDTILCLVMVQPRKSVPT